MKHDPAKLNRQISSDLQSAAEAKLGRSLTADEEYRIWNLGSFMGLESLGAKIWHAESPEDVERILAGLPKGEPLPEEYTRRGNCC